MLRPVIVFILAILGAMPMRAEDLHPGAWQLASIDGEPFTLTATLRIGADGRIGGDAPCNRWFARGVGADGALFGAIGSTERACEGLSQERRFLELMAEMTAAALIDDGLVLTGAGHRLDFVPLAD